MDNPEKLATYGTQDEQKTQFNMYLIPLYANKHNQREEDMRPPTNN